MALAGKDGKFAFDGDSAPQDVADLREWTLNVDRDLFEVSTFGSSGWREFQQNMNGASGSANGYWNVAASTQMANLQTNILSQSAAATAEFWVDTTNGNGYTAEVFVTGLTVGASVDGVVPFDVDFTVTGAVTYSTTLT